MTLAETIITGMNNPECAFFVGQSLGYASSGTLIVRVGLIYFGFKILDKFVFERIPSFIKKVKPHYTKDGGK